MGVNNMNDLPTFIVRLSPRPELGPKAHDEVLPRKEGGVFWGYFLGNPKKNHIPLLKEWGGVSNDPAFL